MKNSLIVFFAVSLICGAASYIASASIPLGIGVAVVFFLVFLLLVIPMIDRFSAKERKRHECFHFIHTFVTTLSVSESLDLAYESACAGKSKEFDALCASISELSTWERIQYLDSYFGTVIYRMFLSTLSIYQEQGGDIISLSNELLAELTRIEETGNKVVATNRKNLFQFILLWTMSLAITVFLRFSLANFYSLLSTSAMFFGCLIAYFTLLLVSLVIYVSAFTQEKVTMPFGNKVKRKEETA